MFHERFSLNFPSHIIFPPFRCLSSSYFLLKCCQMICRVLWTRDFLWSLEQILAINQTVKRRIFIKNIINQDTFFRPKFWSSNDDVCKRSAFGQQVSFYWIFEHYFLSEPVSPFFSSKLFHSLFVFHHEKPSRLIACSNLLIKMRFLIKTLLLLSTICIK